MARKQRRSGVVRVSLMRCSVRGPCTVVNPCSGDAPLRVAPWRFFAGQLDARRMLAHASGT